MPTLPTGTVTFLFTDIEGSTKRWEQHPLQMKPALQRHDAILRQAIEANGGYVFKLIGDAFCAAFQTAPQALQAALDAQRALHTEEWPTEIGEVRVRMALHPGAVELRDSDYVGPALNRMARLLAAGHGGQVLLSLSAEQLVRDNLPEGAGPRDMGEHRLKDLQRPERIFQLVAQDLPSGFPPLKTLDARPNNLPVQPTPFVGREKEVAGLAALLRRQDVSLVTLTGPGGIGKTRLALQAAAELIDEFKDGVFFVNLAPITDPALVTTEMAQTLGVREAGGQPLAASLKEHLKDKQMLLVLDNFEQVVAASLMLAELLSAAPQLKVLVTSRILLHLRSEHDFPVPPLQLPDPKHPPPVGAGLVAALTQYDAVKLFIERAVAIKPDFQVTNENAPAVAEICYRLDGLPLAIELAAARIRILTPQAMLARLQSRLKLLTGGPRDLPARQQTLRAAIEWSYDLLDGEEKQLFNRLAVFRGGRTLEAVEAVCNAGGDLQIDPLDGLTSLIDKSLLHQEEGVGGEPRFVMLETIHEYATERLEESGEAEVLRRAHADYFLALAEQAEEHLSGPGQIEWLARLEEEHDNFRAALGWAMQQGEVDIALRLSAALAEFWWLRGHWSEGGRWLEEALAMSGAEQRTVTRARALAGAGRMAAARISFAAAYSQFEESLEIARELGDKPTIARALYYLGRTANYLHETTRARSLLDEGLAVARDWGYKPLIADMLGALSSTYGELGDYPSERAAIEEGLAISRELGDRVRIAAFLNTLGEKARRQGDYARARALYEEALLMERDTDDRFGIGVVLLNLGAIAYRSGEQGPTAAIFEEALAVWQQLGFAGGVAMCHTGLAGAAELRGEVERAARLVGAADALFEVTGDSFLSPPDRADRDLVVSRIRAYLGEEAFKRAWEEGRNMTMEQAIAYAYEEASRGR